MDTPIHRIGIVLLIVILLGGCTWKQQTESAYPVSPQPVLPGEYFITHHLMTDQGLIRTSLQSSTSTYPNRWGFGWIILFEKRPKFV